MDKILDQVTKLEIPISSLKTLIDDAVRAGRKIERVEVNRDKNPHYSDTEKMLYKYPMLKIKVNQDNLDIEDLEKEMQLFGGTRKSKDIVSVPNGGVRLDPEEKQAALIADKESSRDKTSKEITKIENAIEKIKDYEGHEIIELRYIKRIEPDEIMNQLSISKATFYRWKNRIINDLSIIFFG